MAVLEILCKFETRHTLKPSFSGLISSINSRDRTFFLSGYKKNNKNLEMEKLPIFITSKDLRKKLDVNFKP